MSVPTSTLLLLALVAIAVCGAMAILGTNPFASAKTFGICATVAITIAIAVVGSFSLIDGPPRITRF